MAKNKEDRIRYASGELIEKGNLNVVEEMFSADYIAHAGGKKHSGRAFIKRFARQIRSAIPNTHIVEVEVLTQHGSIISW